MKVQARRGRDVAASTASRARVAHQHARVANGQQGAGLAHRLLAEEAAARERAFEASFQAERNRGDDLDRRFREALEQAKKEPITRPERAFDLD